MTERDDFLDPDDLLAAEYALGVLTAEQRQSAGRRLSSDVSFAARVQEWDGRLNAFAGDVPQGLAPSAELWPRIKALISTPNPPARKAEQNSGLWGSLPFWRGLSLASLILAAASIATLLLLGIHTGDRQAQLQPPPKSQAQLVARLTADGPGAAFVAAFDPVRGTLLIVSAAAANAGARVPELWFMSPEGVPRSVGVFDLLEPTNIRVPGEMVDQLKSGAELAISLEPAGGSPTGQPTGPVIAKGTLSGV